MSVRVTSRIVWARMPLVMNIFEPLITYSPLLSSSSARVRIEATSEPASGSVIPRQKISSPRIAPGR